MFKEKGEVAIDGKFSQGETFVGLEMHSAYALTDHFGFQVNGMIWGALDQTFGALADFGLGYFTPVGEHFVFETYAGYGIGRVQPTFYNLNTPSGGQYAIELEQFKYDRYFIQPAFGYTSKNLDFIFSTRLNLIDYYGNIPLYVTPDTDYENLELKELDEFYTIDPAMTIRLGWRYFKFTAQAVYLIPLESQHRNFDEFFPPFYDRLNFNLGMHINFGGHYNQSTDRTDL